MKKSLIRYIVLILSIFLLALNYNLFLAPNYFVIGGVGGLGIVVEKILHLKTSIFIALVSIILILLSYFLLGKKETFKAILGSILYPFFIFLTTPIASKLINYLEFDSKLILVLIAGLGCGISNGLIYKTGFNTGGSDIIMKIVNKYWKISESKALLYINGSIVLTGLIVCGINEFIYSLIILFININIVNRILIGVSNSKLFFIHTKYEEKIEDFILNELKTGVTILKAQGGFTQENNSVLMCVVANRDYYLFKEMVLKIDSHAFFIINDCYEVAGGVKRQFTI